MGSTGQDMPPNERRVRDERRSLADARGDRKLALVVVMVLLIAGMAAFFPALSADFVDWDDKQNLVDNDRYQGFSPAHLSWMFTSGLAGHYHPLTWLSFAVDHAAWGLDPFGFHLTNIVLHLATGAGLFIVVRELLSRASPRTPCHIVTLAAGVTALLFLVHPLRVESVAWATERRDVLSGAWVMATLWLYLRATEAPPTRRRRLMGAAIGCHTVALLCKAAAVPVPAVLLVLDIYPLRRLRWGLGSGAVHGGSSAPSQHPPDCPAPTATLGRLLIEKALFLLPSLLVATLALWAQADAGALRSIDEHPLGLRIAQAFYGVMFYPWKTIWPSNLLPLYEQRLNATPFDGDFVLAAVAALCITGAAIGWRRRAPWFLAAWVIYVALLSPMLGLFQSGPQVVADRYSYLSCVPWAVLTGAGWMHVAARVKRSTMGFLALLVPPLVVAGVYVQLSREQTGVWVDSYTLWTTLVQRAPQTATAHSNLSVVLNNLGEYERARDEAITALSILPGNRFGHFSLARASLELGDLRAAEEHFLYVLGIDERIGRKDAAPVLGLAMAYTRADRPDDAERLYRMLIEWEPNSADAHANLAGFLASRDRRAEAIESFVRALQLEPGRAEVTFRLSVLLVADGQFARAAEYLEQGLTHHADDPLMLAQLALIRATAEDAKVREPAASLRLAERLWSSVGDRGALTHEAYAAALAANGRHREAIAIINEFLARPEPPLPTATEERLRSRLVEYRAAAGDGG